MDMALTNIQKFCCVLIYVIDTFVREMRAKFDEHNLKLTAAVSAGYQTVNQVSQQLLYQLAIRQSTR